MSRSNAQFLVNFTPLESPVSQLSNEVKHVKNGVVDLEIWSFEVGRQENLENVFKTPVVPLSSIGSPYPLPLNFSFH